MVADPVFLADGGVTFLVIGVLLAAAAALSRKQPGSGIVSDDRPDNLASRGTFITRVVGRRRVGPSFCWLPPDPPTSSSAVGEGPFGVGPSGAGKGTGATPGGQTFREDGLHVICVGPAAAIHGIRQNGKEILGFTITPESHPSGTVVDTQGQGSFKIFWGFPDDPVISELGAASNHGVATRYPYTTKVLWQPKELGGTRQWPRLLYEVEVWPQHSTLPSEPAMMPDKADDALPVWPDPLGVPGERMAFRVHDLNLPANLDSGQIVVTLWANEYYGPASQRYVDSRVADSSFLFQGGSVLAFYDTGESFEPDNVVDPSPPLRYDLSSVGGDTGTGDPVYYFIESAVYEPSVYADGRWRGVLIFRAGLGNVPYVPVRLGRVKVTLRRLAQGRIEIAEAGVGVIPNPRGEFFARPVQSISVDGCNYAHLIEELMFAPWPHGSEKKRELYDLQSLDYISRRLGLTGTDGFEGEALRADVEMRDGEDLKSVLGRLMQDAGIFLSLNPSTGKFRFRLIREEEPIEIDDSALLSPLPEITNVISGRAPSRAAFLFNNRDRNYRQDPLVLDDDGQAQILETQRTESNDISTTTSLDTAAKIAPRRQAEIYAQGTALKLPLSRDCRLLSAGDTVNIPLLELRAPLRITGIKRDPLTSAIEAAAVVDHYSAGFSTGLSVLGGGEIPERDDPPAVPLSVPHDIAVAIFELPRILAPTAASARIIVARARSSAAVSGAIVYGSRDGISYDPLQATGTYWTCVQLTEELPASASFELEDGPTGVALGPDIDSIESLTTVPHLWRAGRQVAIFEDGSGAVEITFLRDISIGAEDVTLEGVLRARLGTHRRTWPEGTRVWITRSHLLEQISNALLQPGYDLYVKTQPFSSSSAAQLETAPVVQLPSVLQGDTLRYAPVEALRTGNILDGWHAGGDIVLEWCYQNYDTLTAAAGLQDAGKLMVFGPVVGQFRVRLRDSVSDDVKLEMFLTSSLATINNAALVTAFGSEPASLVAEVTHVVGSTESQPTRLTVSKL